MFTGPKYKIARRLGAPVFEKTQTQKFALSEGRKSKIKRGRRKMKSDFGLQLIEKQKARYVYGLTEKQFRNYVKEAVSQNKVTSSDYIYTKLESRIDNIVYRAGLAESRRHARQLSSHGHITVNGRKITIPSHILGIGDKFAIRKESSTKRVFTVIQENPHERSVPQWLLYDMKKNEGSIVATPKLADAQDTLFNLSTILEFYSR